jgi:hypothetical protein
MAEFPSPMPMFSRPVLSPSNPIYRDPVDNGDKRIESAAFCDSALVNLLAIRRDVDKPRTSPLYILHQTLS